MGFGAVSCVGKGLTKTFQARESDTHNPHGQSLGQLSRLYQNNNRVVTLPAYTRSLWYPCTSRAPNELCAPAHVLPLIHNIGNVMGSHVEPGHLLSLGVLSLRDNPRQHWQRWCLKTSVSKATFSQLSATSWAAPACRGDWPSLQLGL